MDLELITKMSIFYASFQPFLDFPVDLSFVTAEINQGLLMLGREGWKLIYLSHNILHLVKVVV